jgi:glycosyltransferase involved in cell wall biosynthesis
VVNRPRQPCLNRFSPGHGRIAHVTTVHPPTDTRILVKECRSLERAGLDVTLFAPTTTAVTIEGVRIEPLREFRSRLARMIYGSTAALIRCLRYHPQICHLHDPELLPAAAVLRLFGVRVVFDVHEDLPGQVLTKPWIPKAWRPVTSRLARIWEHAVAWTANVVVIAEPGVFERFPGANKVLVENSPLIEEFDSALPRDQLEYSNRPQRIAYVGGVSMSRGLGEMVDATSLLRRGGSHVTLSVAGRAQSSIAGGAPPYSDGVQFMGWLDRRAVVALLADSRAGLVVLHPEPNYIDSQPTKLFEYMAAGLPVIASDFPRWREIVLSAQCGLVVDPLRPDEIALAAGWLLENPTEAFEMGRRGRIWVEREKAWSREERVLTRAYGKLLDHVNFSAKIAGS